MVNYTNNYCRNPACQLGLTGFSSLLDAAVVTDSTNVLYGSQSALVTCPGNISGEGCILPGGIIPGNSVCSASCYVTGTGSLTISAAVNPGGVIVNSAPVICTGQWQRIVFEGISCTPGQTLYLIVSTTTAQSCAFWISGIQCEDSSPAHPYCDGDQFGCEWTEGFWGGISTCFYENPVVAASNIQASSDTVGILEAGEAFYITPAASDLGNNTYSDLVIIGNAAPAGAVKDFAVSQLTDPDPAQSYVSWNTAGTPSSTDSSYTRSWASFYPPGDYLVSSGNLWNRAAYMAAGWYFASLPEDGTASLARVQVEVLPLGTGYSQPAPSSFDSPRSIHSIVVPDRLNYCVNPSIEVDTSSWSAIGTASLVQDGTVSVGDIIEYDDNILTAGTHSLKVTVNSNGDGAQISVSDLITQRTYIASAYVQAGPGFDDIIMSIANGSASVLSAGGTGYGAGDYDSGPYGGIDPSADLATGTWFRIYCIFTAASDTEVLQITSSAASDISYPSYIWVDAVLIEPGEVLSFYFDGSFGTNYSWESTAGKSRSYYYDEQAVKGQAFLNVLAGHVPLGISYDAPQFSVPPIA